MRTKCLTVFPNSEHSDVLTAYPATEQKSHPQQQPSRAACGMTFACTGYGLKLPFAVTTNPGTYRTVMLYEYYHEAYHAP